MWHRLVELGLLKDVLATGVAVGGAHLFALIPGPIKRHLRAQQRIADSLNTTTPGGLTDVVTAVNPKAQK